jgi:cytochrome c biogenesis protein CcdA/thiol-disulfide isomerase/thioredoxin
MTSALFPLATALAAGMATAASPCILPMLPLLLGASAARPGAPRHRPLSIIAGFVLSFAATVLLFGATTQVLGVSQAALRNAGIAVMLLSGLLLMWPSMLDRAMAPFGRLADLAQRLGNRAGAGYVGGLLIGGTLGLLWTPCAGPVLASALALVATAQQQERAFALLLAYALGAGLPMLAIAYGGQAASVGTRRLTAYAGTLRRVFGGLVVVTAAAMLWQADVSAVAWLSRTLSLSGAKAANSEVDATKAPELQGLTHWINSPALTLAQLRGKVVLLDFWTFGCVNCINTLPELALWHERYGPRGLTVIGVHTPEFSFERDSEALASAVRRHGIPYAVAQDNAYATWRAFGVAAWPTQVLIDREGRVLWRHVGEGDEEQIARRIEEALAR